MENDGPRFVCNECDAETPKEDVGPLVLEIDSCEATCRHCGPVNQFQGFSEIRADLSSLFLAAELGIPYEPRIRHRTSRVGLRY
jgi:hypothetical protein